MAKQPAVTIEDPRLGTFSHLSFQGGMAPGLAGPWQLTHIGFGQWGYVHVTNGNFVALERVNIAHRTATTRREL